MMRLKPQRILLIIPVCLLGIGLLLGSLQGPYFFGDNLDPDYCYLLNSLNLLTFHMPGHTDHPGTTLQMLGAVVVFIRWVASCLFGEWHGLQETVLTHPEEFLRTINLVLNILISGAVYWAARQMYSWSNSLFAALVLQASFLLFKQPFLAQTRVSPEPLLVAVGFALMIPLIPILLEKADSEDTGKYVLAAGAVFGFGLVTKVTFLPWIAILIPFRGYIRRLRFLTAALLACLALTLPIWPQLPRVARWFTDLLTHSQRYGQGSVGLPPKTALYTNLVAQVRDEPIMVLLFFVYAGLLLALYVFRQRLPGAANVAGVLLAGCVGIILQTVATIKHPAPHYILPALVLIPLINAVVVAQLSRSLHDTSQKWLTAVVLIAALPAIGYNLQGMVNLAHWTQAYRDDVRNLARQVAVKAPGCKLVGMYRSSVPTFALSFGDDFAFEDQASVLDQLYPSAINYNVYAKQFSTLGNKPGAQALRRMVLSGDCILMQGTPLTPEIAASIKGMRLEQIAAGAKETVYKLVPDSAAAQPLLSIPVLPPGSLTVEAEQFSSGNVAVDKDYYGVGIGVITTPKYPAYAEYAFQVGTAGKYDVLIRYASEQPRPVNLLVNGVKVSSDACSIETGGFTPEHQLWQKVGAFAFKSGRNTLRLESNGPFPHLDKFALVASH